MADSIISISHRRLLALLSALGKAGGTIDHVDWICGNDGINAALLIRFIDQQLSLSENNPYKMTVDEQLASLRRANDEEGWGLTKIDFACLASSAPAWPQGYDAYRSLRIRFGEGSEGVAKTFEAHYTRIQHVFGKGRYWRWEFLKSGKDRLRLLMGDHTHKACIEWIVFDLYTHRKREDVTAVRGSKSLADELLVVAWMFPDMIRAIHHNNLPSLFAAGYEANIPEYDDAPWQRVVDVGFNCNVPWVSMGAHRLDHNDCDHSVPSRR